MARSCGCPSSVGGLGFFSGFGGRADPPGPSAATIYKHLKAMSASARGALFTRMGWSNATRGGNGMLMHAGTPQQATMGQAHTIAGFLSGRFGSRPKQWSELVDPRTHYDRTDKRYVWAGEPAELSGFGGLA